MTSHQESLTSMSVCSVDAWASDALLTVESIDYSAVFALLHELAVCLTVV